MDQVGLEGILSEGCYASFLDDIFSALEELGIGVAHLEMDHICYRVGSAERYDLLTAALLKDHELLGESEVNGRMISNFILAKPLTYKKRVISILELPAPKKGSSYSEGYEHVEFVTDLKLEEFMETYPTVQFDQKGLAKKSNRDLRVKLGLHSVKFHELSLVEVIEQEASDKRLKNS